MNARKALSTVVLSAAALAFAGTSASAGATVNVGKADALLWCEQATGYALDGGKAPYFSKDGAKWTVRARSGTGYGKVQCESNGAGAGTVITKVTVTCPKVMEDNVPATNPRGSGLVSFTSAGIATYRDGSKYNGCKWGNLK